MLGLSVGTEHGSRESWRCGMSVGTEHGGRVGWRYGMNRMRELDNEL